MLLLVLSALFVFSFYLYCIRNHNYWRKRKVEQDAPIPLFGNHLHNVLGIKSIVTVAVELYKKYPEEKIVGYLRGSVPELVIRDVELIRRIMTVDFLNFHHRGLGRNPKIEPIFGNLFHADGDLWKLLRQRLTPAFTSAKLKAMFPLVVCCAESLQKSLGDGGEKDAREFMARFTTEFIGACGFGIEMDTINNERSHFRELGKRIFNMSYKDRAIMLVYELFPELSKVVYVRNKSVEKAITLIMEKLREQRGYKPSGRNDFVDLLLQLEAKGKIVTESIEKQNQDGSPMEVEMEMDLPMQAAQLFIFFAAGFETSSSATSYTLHELAYNPEVQRKVQMEIDEVMSKYDNKLSYNAIEEMTYLDMTFKEGMRKFPSLGVLNRVCVRKYTITELNVTLDPGVRIIIPVQAIHMDEKYFDSPEEFRPERFTNEATTLRHKFAYLPFGEGPRACIGLGRNPKIEPIFGNLFHADGDLWKLLRQRLTPAFTSAKLKAMFPLVVCCAESLQKSLGDGGEKDAREFMARFTTEFIGACGFGIEMDTINNERSHFRELGKRIFNMSYKDRAIMLVYELFPELSKVVYVRNKSVEKAITLIMEKLREQRGYKPSGRNDFVDLLLQLEAKGKIVTESIEKQNQDGSPMEVEMEMDLPMQAAQLFIFFAAGFETSSSATSYTLHELAYNPEVQRKVQMEIDEVMSKYDNKLSYNAIEEMTYLDMTFKEGMRKFPSLGVLNRVCVRKYTITELNVTLDPGVRIIIPVQAIHMDEKYFDSPEEFRPERFTNEATTLRHKFAYLPFGEGPRACIGMYILNYLH